MREDKEVGLAARPEIERQIERLHLLRSEMRPASRREERLSSLVVTDRIDRWGRYLHVDREAEEILGFPLSIYNWLIGWVRYCHPDDRWRSARLWQRALAGISSPPVEYRTPDVSGKWVWLEDSFRPLRYSADGHAQVVEGRWRDITSRKRREVEFLLRQWESLLGRRCVAALAPRGLILPFPLKAREPDRTV